MARLMELKFDEKKDDPIRTYGSEFIRLWKQSGGALADGLISVNLAIYQFKQGLPVRYQMQIQNHERTTGQDFVTIDALVEYCKTLQKDFANVDKNRVKEARQAAKRNYQRTVPAPFRGMRIEHPRITAMRQQMRQQRQQFKPASTPVPAPAPAQTQNPTSSSSQTKEMVKCYKCGKMGHMAKECRTQVSVNAIDITSPPPGHRYDLHQQEIFVISDNLEFKRESELTSEEVLVEPAGEIFQYNGLMYKSHGDGMVELVDPPQPVRIPPRMLPEEYYQFTWDNDTGMDFYE
jgi:hypothetical protein